MRNFYKVLGIGSTADDRRIKSAFRKRAKAVHPDLNPGYARAEARFIELVQAYEVLSDAESRAAYDAYLGEQRRRARRHFAHCAALMAASFMLTATSALLVMGFAGANVPYRETWQLAVAALSPDNAQASPAAGSSDAGWTAHVATAPVSESPPPPKRTEPAHGPKPSHGRHATAETRPAEAASKASAARNGQAGLDMAAKARRRHIAAQPAPASPESWWSFPADDEPRYSLGASDIR